MAEYEVKRGLAKKINLKDLLDIHFGSARQEGEWFVTSYGNMPVIKARYVKDQLLVETQSDPSFAPRVAKGDAEATKIFQDTHSRWNAFLFDATGYDAKTRGKKAQEKAKKEGKTVAA